MITLFMDKPSSSNAQPVRSPAPRFSLPRRLSFRRPQSLSLQAFASPPTSPRHAASASASAQEEKEEEALSPFSLVNRLTGRKTSNPLSASASNEEEELAPRPLLRRRSSNSFAMLFSSPGSSSSATSRLSSSRDLSVNANVQRLARTIPGKRKQLVNELVGTTGDLAVKIRFVDAVDQYLAERDETKQRKMGKTILLLFVVDDMFKIRSFTPDTQCQLERERYDYLHVARLEMLNELVLDKTVLAAMDLLDRPSSA